LRRERSSSITICKATGEEDALSDSGPLRPAVKKHVLKEVLACTFGFQACPAPSLTADANLYRLAVPEQRLAD
jgi:hypothetical protein